MIFLDQITNHSYRSDLTFITLVVDICGEFSEKIVIAFSLLVLKSAEMYFTNEERRVLVFLKIDEGLSLRKTAQKFHQRFPARPIPSAGGIKKLFGKFRATGSVFNRPKSGRPKSATNEENEVLVLGSVVMKTQQSLREIAIETASSITSAWRILRRHKFHPYGIRLTQELNEADYALRLDFCEEMEKITRDDPNFLKIVCFTDESTFHLNGYVNRHNCRYWCQQNPNEYRQAHTQYPQKLNVWAGIFGREIIGPFFINGELNGPKYVLLLHNQIVPAMRASAARQQIPWADVWFQQDGAPAHWARLVRDYLDLVFPNRWIGRDGPWLWPPRSPDLTPLDFFLWGFLKDKVFRTGFPRNLQEMRDRIEENCLLVDEEMLGRVRESFTERIFLCMHEDGKQFEHLL